MALRPKILKNMCKDSAAEITEIATWHYRLTLVSP